jgi:putative transcriptional regulator
MRSSLPIRFSLLLAGIAMAVAGSAALAAGLPDRLEVITREPAAGMFLVAGRELHDPHFRKTVVFILRHDDEGSVGLVVNRPIDLRLSEAIPDLDDQQARSHYMHYGGPVAISLVSMLLKDGEASRLIRHISSDIYISADRRVLDRLLAEKHPQNRLRFYLGHAGWTAGQLAIEIERHDWHVISADTGLIFNPDIGTLWQRLIDHLEPGGILVRSPDPSSRMRAEDGNSRS